MIRFGKQRLVMVRGFTKRNSWSRKLGGAPELRLDKAIQLTPRMRRTVYPFFILAASLVSLAQNPISQYIMGPNVQVSVSDPTLRHYESYVGTDPRRAKHLIACAFVVRPYNQID